MNSNYAVSGATFIYELVEWNETLGNSLGITLADIDSVADVGEQRCYRITSITKSSNYWTISYQAWNWGSDFYSYTPYTNSIQIYFYPEDEGDNVDYIHPDLMSIIPIPVDEYLERIDWSSDASSSNMSYTFEKTVSPHTFDLIVSYGIEGYLKSIIWTYNNDLLLNITYMGELTGGPTSIAFGETYLIFTITTIAIVIIIGKWKIKK